MGLHDEVANIYVSYLAVYKSRLKFCQVLSEVDLNIEFYNKDKKQ